MLDPDEVANFEAWKERKLTGSTDLSVHAYNVEQEGLALAYDAGVRAACNPSDHQKINSLLESSPYRRKGMTAYVAPKRVTGE